MQPSSSSSSTSEQPSTFNLPSELLSFLPSQPSSPPPPLLPRTRIPTGSIPMSSPAFSLPLRIPFSPRRIKYLLFSFFALLLIYFLLLRPSSSSPYSPFYNIVSSPTPHPQEDIGHPIDYTPNGLLDVFRQGTKTLLQPPKPRDPLVDGLTDLGPLADQSYHLDIVSSPEEYLSTLRTFIQNSFPSHLQPRLLASLDAYWAGSDLPAMVDHKTVWQTDKEAHKHEAGDWSRTNGGDGWKWKMLGDREADEWVKETLGVRKAWEEKSKVELGWEALELGILRSDALRYLVLLLEGGVYSDTDTVCLRPISQWGQNPNLLPGAPSSLLRTRPSVVIGVEADVGMREDWNMWWPRPLQIVQWTLSSAPHHPIFLDVLRRILLSSERAALWTSHRDALVVKLETEGKTEEAETVRHLKVLTMKGGEVEGLEGGVSVMDWTGPGVWTDGVFAYLKARFNLDWPILKDIRKPLRVEEISILPVTGFSPGVGSFGAEGTTDEQAMAQHKFSGSWKGADG